MLDLTAKMQMKFDMPFNWNPSKLNKSSIFVHEEITVPKPNAFTTWHIEAYLIDGKGQIFYIQSQLCISCYFYKPLAQR